MEHKRINSNKCCQYSNYFVWLMLINVLMMISTNSCSSNKIYTGKSVTSLSGAHLSTANWKRSHAYALNQLKQWIVYINIYIHGTNRIRYRWVWYVMVWFVKKNMSLNDQSSYALCSMNDNKRGKLNLLFHKFTQFVVCSIY